MYSIHEKCGEYTNEQGECPHCPDNKEEEAVKGAYMKKLSPGTVRHGTLDPEDLIHHFIEALATVNKKLASKRIKEANELTSEQYEEQDELVEQLLNDLDKYAPKGYYFGSHVGDGSDFGCWPEL